MMCHPERSVADAERSRRAAIVKNDSCLRDKEYCAILNAVAGCRVPHTFAFFECVGVADDTDPAGV